ncbi:helix-turn-helix domain-containing protein [Streptomyces sparsogenes]|uniref:helix-turn-helix domain-containing protein n=1 Tax=Streptomyces sparsogenes TaxID=67365 RepID=UPI0033F6CF2F
MAEQQLSAHPRAHSGVSRSAGGVTQISDYQPRRYTIIGNHLTQHRDLSLTAIGLGAHIQSLPDGTAVDIRTLAGKFAEGRERIAAALRELEDHGYIKRIRERTPEGRIVTRTLSYNVPRGTTAHRTPQPTAHHTPQPTPQPTAEPDTEPLAGPVAEQSAPPAPKPAVRPPVATTPPPPPSTDTTPTPLTPPPPPPARPHRPAPPPLPQPTAPTPQRHHTAAALLAELRREDARLLLAERDVRRLTPAVATWLERDAAPDAVRRTLTASLPPDLRHPAALLAHRLTALLPPPLPAAAQPTPRPAVVPLQNCDGCDRAFRSPHPGLCRDCRTAPSDPDLPELAA